MRIVKIANKDWDVSLECVCADDFGASYKDKLTTEDQNGLDQYEATRDAHQKLKSLADENGIRNYIEDTDDRDSKHSDAYLYFPWSQLRLIQMILRHSGAEGDVLDVPDDFPVLSRAFAENLGWDVEVK